MCTWVCSWTNISVSPQVRTYNAENMSSSRTCRLPEALYSFNIPQMHTARQLFIFPYAGAARNVVENACASFLRFTNGKLPRGDILPLHILRVKEPQTKTTRSIWRSRDHAQPQSCGGTDGRTNKETLQVAYPVHHANPSENPNIGVEV